MAIFVNTPGSIGGNEGPPSRKRRFRTALLFLALPGLAALLVAAYGHRRPLRRFIATGVWRADRTVEQALAEFEPEARKRLGPACRKAGLGWLPKSIVLLAFKQEKILELWGAGAPGEAYRFLRSYPVLAASGIPGPKQRSGDRQVPEGFYDLPDLNPNSLHHLSIRVDYPNENDLSNACVPLEEMGGDIFLHGGDRSIGCLAVGDPAIEELFVLAALAGPENRRLLICPVDFRREGARAPVGQEAWVGDLYARLAEALRAFSR